MRWMNIPTERPPGSRCDDGGRSTRGERRSPCRRRAGALRQSASAIRGGLAGRPASIIFTAGRRIGCGAGRVVFRSMSTTAQGAHIRDVDGLDYVDFCLGDTGGMCGHAPEAVTRAVTRQMQRGATMMLPTEDSVWVGAGAVAPIRSAPLDADDVGDRCQSRGHPDCADDHRPKQGAGVLRLLSWRRRRGSCRDPRWAGRACAT